MRKAVLVLSVLLCFWATALAQMKKGGFGDATAIGIKGGLTIPKMLYTDGNLFSLDQDFVIKPIGGAFVDIPLNEMASFAPEVMLAQRGMATSYVHHSGTLVNYHIASNHVDLRLPFCCRYLVVNAFQPYAIAGIEAGCLLGGEIHLDRSNPDYAAAVDLDTTISIGAANMDLVHVGIFAGLGVRSDIDLGHYTLMIRLEATYHQGFVDSYSQMEHEETATPVNVNAYEISGLRLPYGFEFCLYLGVPLKFKHPRGACWSFSRNKYK